MKRLRQICAVTILTLLLTNFALADEGIIHPQYVPPPPHTTAEVIDPAATAGEAEVRGEDSASDLTTEMMLLIIQNMLALF